MKQKNDNLRYKMVRIETPVVKRMSAYKLIYSERSLSKLISKALDSMHTSTAPVEVSIIQTPKKISAAGEKN